MSAAAVLLWGCAGARPGEVRRTEILRVHKPVPVRAEAPPELLAPFEPGELPEFVSPQDPAASSALTPEGEARLKRLVLELLSRFEALRAWAGAASSPKPQDITERTGQ